MPIRREYIESCDLMLTQLVDEISDKDLMNEVHRLNKMIQSHPNLKELADCRLLSECSQLTTRGATRSASQENIRSGSKLAIVIPSDSLFLFGIARAYKTFSETRRKEVQIYLNLPDALHWLQLDDSGINEVNKRLHEPFLAHA